MQSRRRYFTELGIAHNLFLRKTSHVMRTLDGPATSGGRPVYWAPCFRASVVCGSMCARLETCFRKRVRKHGTLRASDQATPDGCALASGGVFFDVSVWDGQKQIEVNLWCQCRPGNKGEAVLTIVLESHGFLRYRGAPQLVPSVCERDGFAVWRPYDGTGIGGTGESHRCWTRRWQRRWCVRPPPNGSRIGRNRHFN